MPRKAWNVMLVPEGEGTVRTLRIPVRLVYVTVGLVVFGLFSVAASVGLHIWNLQGFRSMKLVRKENTVLRNHLAQMGRKLVGLEDQVRDSETMERQARLLAGLDPLDAETRQLGVGGPFIEEDPVLPLADAGLAGTLQEHEERLDVLTRRVSFQKRSFEETLESLQHQGERLARTPSICPVRGQYVVSCGYGSRTDPFTGRHAFHHGLDLRAEAGTPVVATAAGDVVFSGWNGEFGRSITIRHGNGCETSYSHLASTRVQSGAEVQRGEVIGTVGSSGRSTGPHLHYEVRVEGRSKDPQDHILSLQTMVD